MSDITDPEIHRQRQEALFAYMTSITEAAERAAWERLLELKMVREVPERFKVADAMGDVRSPALAAFWFANTPEAARASQAWLAKLGLEITEPAASPLDAFWESPWQSDELPRDKRGAAAAPAPGWVGWRGISGSTTGDIDREDQWSERIAEAHPMRLGNSATYALAEEMVANRRSKKSLVELVNWLLMGAAGR